METPSIQLYTHDVPPAWWSRLQAADTLSCLWSVSSEILKTTTVLIVPQSEVNASHADQTCIVVGDSWTLQDLQQIRARLKGVLFFDSTQPSTDGLRVIKEALVRHTERIQQSQLMQIMRLQNRQIDELNLGLEHAVRERTTYETQSRRAGQKNISRVREIIAFIKEMAQVLEIADLLPLIRRQVKEYHFLESPLLYTPRGENFGDLYYMRGSQTIRTRVRSQVEVSLRIRVNESNDSQFLANAMGRPFAKVIRVPLMTGRPNKDHVHTPLLFFEHNVQSGEIDQLLTALSERLQPVSWAVDRLVLERELKSTSRDWEMTFDELSEPIAILNNEGEVLRANSHWRDPFKEVLQQISPSLRVGNQLYSVEKYPIRMTLDSPPISWVVYLRDETRSQKLKSQMIQVEKMSAIGLLAGHIAHELNNPLTGIRSLTQVLLTEISQISRRQLYDDLQEVERAAGRCQGIINNLLEFSRGGLVHKIQVLDLNEITRKTLPFLKSATGKFRSAIRLSEDELLVKVEPHLMQQVIFNLVNNACQAMNEKGEISVSTKRTSRWAVLEVEDTGPGIANELRDRIFEPFFTTKPEGEGTGLGLSLSRDFVRQFGGDLECESRLAHGSIFRVRLPLESKNESTHS